MASRRREAAVRLWNDRSHAPGDEKDELQTMPCENNLEQISGSREEVHLPYSASGVTRKADAELDASWARPGRA